MKNETKIIIWLSIILLLSLLGNGFLLGASGDDGDYSKQLQLYEELNRKSNITEGLLTEGLSAAKKDLDESRSISDKLREANRALTELNDRREKLDRVAESLSGRTRVEIVQGITSIDSGAERLRGLQDIEQAERQALSGLLGSE